jgi:hypothetical protein
MAMQKTDFYRIAHSGVWEGPQKNGAYILG